MNITSCSLRNAAVMSFVRALVFLFAVTTLEWLFDFFSHKCFFFVFCFLLSSKPPCSHLPAVLDSFHSRGHRDVDSELDLIQFLLEVFVRRPLGGGWW